jgi:hypothetical protein
MNQRADRETLEMAGKGIGNRSSPFVHEGNSEVCHVARQRDHPAISPIPCVFAAPKRIGLKSHIRLSRVLIKSSLITSPDVSTHLRPD